MIRRSLIAMLCACLLLAAACGDDGGSDDASPTSSAGSGTNDGDGDAPAGDTVTIDHAFGSTEIEGVPERIVSLNTQWNGVLGAFGVTPVGYASDPSAGEGGLFPWDVDFGDATAIEALATLPLEQIASLDPDLILVTYLAVDESTYEQLSAIAPTIPLLGDRQVDTWQDLTTVMGEVLRDPDAAQAVIDDVEGQLAAAADDLPGLADRTFAFVNYIPNDMFYVVADPEDGSSLFFQSLGLEISPTLLDAAAGASGRIEVSFEQVSMLDSDLLVMFTQGADPNEIVGFENLPAVQNDAFAAPDYATIVGLNTPSPLSIPYVLEQLLPTLEAAAGS